MKNILWIISVLMLFASCGGEKIRNDERQLDCESRKSNIINFDDLHLGKSYLPLYSHIYHVHEHKTFDLTITVSMRNVSLVDSVYILKADYYDTAGENIRQYLKNPIFLKPMETIEIIIAEEDSEGGSGANFVFDWAVKNDKNMPLFEAVMISTNGQQGLSFATRGVQIMD